MRETDKLIDQQVEQALKVRKESRKEALGKAGIAVVLIPLMLVMGAYLFWILGGVGRAETNPVFVGVWIPDLNGRIEGSIDPDLVRATALAVLGFVISALLTLAVQSVRNMKLEDRVRTYLWQRWIFFFIFILSVFTAYLVVLGWIAGVDRQNVDDLSVAAVAAIMALLFVLSFGGSSDLSNEYLQLGDVRSRLEFLQVTLKGRFNNEVKPKNAYLTSVCVFVGQVVIFVVVAIVALTYRYIFVSDSTKSVPAVIGAIFSSYVVIAVLFAINCIYLFNVETADGKLNRWIARMVFGFVYLFLFVVVQMPVYIPVIDQTWSKANGLFVVLWTIIPLVLFCLGVISRRARPNENRYMGIFFGPVWNLILSSLQGKISQACEREEQLLRKISVNRQFMTGQNVVQE